MLQWERCEIGMVDAVIREQNNFGITSNRTQLGLESHCSTGILQVLTKLSCWKSCQTTPVACSPQSKALQGGREHVGGFVHC